MAVTHDDAPSGNTRNAPRRPNRSNENSPVATRTISRVQTRFIQRKDFFKIFPGSCPDNSADITMQSRDYVYKSWQETLRKSDGPVLSEPWPKLTPTGQGAKKLGPTLTTWPPQGHLKYSTKSHLSVWLWECLNQCALMQYSPQAAMSLILSKVANTQTQQQIRQLAGALEVSFDSNDDVDAFYHCIFVLVSEASPTQHEAYMKLTSLKPEDSESIIEYYVRFLSIASLMVNARDYGQHGNLVNQNQLQDWFAHTLDQADRKIDAGKLSQYMADPNTIERHHPREEASAYGGLWSLVLVNERLSTPPVAAASAKDHEPISVLHQSKPVVAHNVAALPATEANNLGKGRSSGAPPSTPPQGWEEVMAKAVASAVATALKQNSQGNPQKRQRTTQEERPESEQAKKMEAARDDKVNPQVKWRDLPFPLRRLITGACRAVKEARELSSDIQVVGQSAKLKPHLTSIQKWIDDHPELKAKMSSAQICYGCIGYGHTYKKGKCPLA